MKWSSTLAGQLQANAKSNPNHYKLAIFINIFPEKPLEKVGQSMERRYSWQNKTTPKKEWVLDTANKRRRLTGTKVNWERLGIFSDEICRNLFKTKPTKSKLCFFDFVVVFAARDIVIDIRMATAGASSKIHRCKKDRQKNHLGTIKKIETNEDKSCTWQTKTTTMKARALGTAYKQWQLNTTKASWKIWKSFRRKLSEQLQNST